ncbi:hypothetical protein HYC85_000655 [Camellia sinensis]|uniref:CCHC-type domain-containing protein n=1 Tax=Camellia sinensis TaxID=4442 RepID=A0A7J7I4M7_CAMSI|nr:hypothetical protein HYC85_000655 [Camellia sinensis]
MTPDRSRSPPRAKRFRSNERASYRDAPYPRDRRTYRQDYLCNKCKRPGHFARDCPNVTVCNNCGLPGTLSLFLVTLLLSAHQQPCVGTVRSQVTSQVNATMIQSAICAVKWVTWLVIALIQVCLLTMQDSATIVTRQATLPPIAPTRRLATTVVKPVTLPVTAQTDPVCNICNISGHVARQCPKSSLPPPEMVGGPFRDIICRNCGHPGHISRDCVSIVICNNCGGRGHQAHECPSVPMFDRGLRRY